MPRFRTFSSVGLRPMLIPIVYVGFLAGKLIFALIPTMRWSALKKLTKCDVIGWKINFPYGLTEKQSYPI